MKNFCGLIGLLVFVMFLLTGCGFKDIDKRAFVVGIGIDKTEQNEEGYEVTLKVAFPSSGSEELGDQFELLSSKGSTIAEAIQLIKAKVSNELDFGHMKVIVLGEKVLSKDIGKTMDWFTRRRDIQQIALITIGKPDAKAILSIEPKGERLPSNKLFMFFDETGTESPYVTTKFLYNLRRDLEERGIDGFLPIVQAEEDNFSITTMSVFKQGVHPLHLTKKETKLFNMLKKGYDKESIKVNAKDEFFMLAVDALNTEYQIKQKQTKKMSIEVTVDISGVIEESKVELKEGKLDKYNKLTEKVLTKDIHKLLAKFQETKMDPIGFGLRYRATRSGTENEKWKAWKSLYPDASINVQVHADITGTGIIE
ncbi:Ger(x)C family spore germination protein [Virgibacillus sp. MSP4-1]|uniref:Ger(x)C family spore germination protein n=1 Tax=Virgibacillus sp. MSP4-1 TaxID=2700081 RepID=UPI0003A92234|nr:Ger(x)C family spore germination protein [Virgibacillus sp. MSP4-1]QHS23853.1 Ger(x)C family spore germination protein [Virgibacillus sp. MSP4-1]